MPTRRAPGGRRFLGQAAAAGVGVPLLEGPAPPALSGSASVEEQTSTVTLMNPSLAATVTARIRVAGRARLREARATVLSHPDMRATNTFDRPDEVALKPLDAPVAGVRAAVRLPPRSVAAVSLRLA